jgi:hypothetical protein
MAETPMLILDRARSNREAARRARRLAMGLTDDTLIERFIRYADELERQALDLEQRAGSVAGKMGDREPLSANIVTLDAEARARLRAQRRKSRSRS